MYNVSEHADTCSTSLSHNPEDTPPPIPHMCTLEPVMNRHFFSQFRYKFKIWLPRFVVVNIASWQITRFTKCSFSLSISTSYRFKKITTTTTTTTMLYKKVGIILFRSESKNVSNTVDFSQDVRIKLIMDGHLILASRITYSTQKMVEQTSM